MTRRAALVALAALVAPAAAAAGTPERVNVEFSTYRPSQLELLPGESVDWTNVSARTHTVTSDTGLFDSGNLLEGRRFVFRFDRPGTYRYHCTIHAGIVGQVDVRRVILGPLPTAAVPLGSRVEFTGRTADPTHPVLIQGSVAGGRYRTIARARPRRDGSWRALVAARATGDYRAASGSSTSAARRLIVGIRRVRVRPTHDGVAVEVTPGLPYGRIVVEVYRRERFGFWPVARTRLDYVSEARVHVSRPARVRVVLVDDDGWTPVATSRVVALARP